ncbi:MAG: hypothetical protein HFJ25_00080 [Clostridia bacterium]|nr:hypothetical protein [Clostridia bacterium]
MKKYKLRKKYYSNVILVLAFLVATLITINIGYSLWSTKLNISGKVTLDLKVPYLDVSIVKLENGHYTYCRGITESDSYKDEISENVLVTTLRISSQEEEKRNINTNFSMKNISKNGDLYTDGKVKLVEHSKNVDAISNISANLSKSVIESGNVDIFNFKADVDRTILENSAYYKYEIVYNVNGIQKNFYYTINIVPA